MERKFVTGLVLAAGASTRLGRPKQLLPYRGTTLLGYVVQQIESCSALDDVVVVLGTGAEAVREQVEFGRARVVLNTASSGQGCSASYRFGIEAFDQRTEAMVVLLGDQPGVTPKTITKVVDDWQQREGKIVLTSYSGVKGHPMIFARELFEQLMGLHGDKAVWKLVDKHPEWVRVVEAGGSLPRDVDTWEDYQALLNQ